MSEARPPVDYHVVTDEELATARRDPAFRIQLITSTLETLLVALARLRAPKNADDPVSDRQLREGAQLAVKLADLLQKLTDQSRAA
jgi:hypothetical protein